MSSFSERLKQAIDKKGISQAEAARMCGIAQQSMNYILKNNLSSSKLAPAIAVALNINPEWLIYGKGRPDPIDIYEIPILHSPYLLEKFLKQKLEPHSIEYTIIDKPLGSQAFGYLLSMKELAICTPLPTTFSPIEYLQIQVSGSKIIKTAGENSYAIYEKRIRAEGY